MKKYKLLFGIYCIAFVLCLTKTSVNASNNILNGEGTVQNPYEINSVHDFIVFANAVNSGVTFENCHIVQNINLDLKKLKQKKSNSIFPIGDVNLGYYFGGTYDGKGHYIENLYIDKDENEAALFSCISGEIRNLGIESGRIEGGCAASFVMHTYGNDALLYNCYNKANVLGSIRSAGLVDSFAGSLINCINLGECIYGETEQGGAVSYYVKNALYVYSIGKVFVDNTVIENEMMCKNISKRELDLYINILNKNLKNVIKYGFIEKENVCFWNGENGKVRFDVCDTSLPRATQEYFNKYKEYIPQDAGSESNPIAISSNEDLCLLSFFTNCGNEYEDIYFQQTEDIDMTQVDDWKTIGSVEQNKVFAGNYDGNGKVIRSLKVENTDYAGLFGQLSGKVYNLILRDVLYEAKEAGGIACIGIGEPLIYNCAVQGCINVKDIAGGIANEYVGGKIYNCWSKLDGNNIYGICGVSAESIIDCYSNIELYNDKRVENKYIKNVSEKNIGDLPSSYLESEDFVKLLNQRIMNNKYLSFEKCYLWKVDREKKEITFSDEGKNILSKLAIWVSINKSYIFNILALGMVLWALKAYYKKNSSEETCKRYKTIDFLRLVFCVNIMLMHWGQFLGEEELFVPCGYIGVVFFFMVSGFFLAKYIYEKQSTFNNKMLLHQETVGYIRKTIKKIMPYYVGSLIISFVVVSYIKFESVEKLINNFFLYIPEIFMLQMTGFPTYAILGVEWYLSALIIALVIIYPILRKYTAMVTYVFAPFFSIMIFGYIAHTCGYLASTAYWTGICYEGVLKAIACIFAGITCYGICRVLEKENFRIKYRMVITGIEWLVWSAIIVGMIKFPKYSANDFVLTLFIFIGLCITFSHVTYTDNLISRKTSDFCARLSIPLFLCHGYLLIVLPQYVNNLGKWQALSVFLIFVLITTIVDYACAIAIKTVVKRLKG